MFCFFEIMPPFSVAVVVVDVCEKLFFNDINAFLCCFCSFCSIKQTSKTNGFARYLFMNLESHCYFANVDLTLFTICDCAQ